MSRVLVVGDLVDDISVRARGAVTRASDTDAEIRMRPGGSAGNVAAWLGHLGVDVTFCGRVGEDAVERHRGALTRHGVRAHVAADADHPTATIVLEIDPDGERTMFVDRGANGALATGDVPEQAWDGVTWLHLTGYSWFDTAVRPVARDLVAQARSRGVAVSLDPSSVAYLRAVGPEVFLDWVEGADLVLPNLDEARCLSGRGFRAAGGGGSGRGFRAAGGGSPGSIGPELELAALAARFPHVVVTLGALGAAYAGAGTREQVTAPRVDVVDTTGAGDAFAAGFLSRWVIGGSAGDALEAGRSAARTCVALPGARPPT